MTLLLLSSTTCERFWTICRACQRICDIPVTQMFGEMWSFTDDKALSDTAWTNEALGAHTDTTYSSIPEGIQVPNK